MNPNGKHLCIGVVGEAFKLGMSPDEGLSDLTPQVFVLYLLKLAGYGEGLGFWTP